MFSKFDDIYWYMTPVCVQHIKREWYNTTFDKRKVGG